jgi:Phage protein Gp138 N-terminal domain/GpV Apex motif
MNVTPTYQQTAEPTLDVTLEAAKRDLLKNLNCVKVGVIQSFDPGDATHAPTATVLIAQLQVTSIEPDGTRTTSPYSPIEKVPVFFPSGGGLTLTFPVAAGDECLLVFNDRELDNWLEVGAGQPPTTPRLHDLTDAICLVGLRSNPRPLANISTTSAQLRSDDGTTTLSVIPGGIVRIHGQLQVDGDIIAGYGSGSPISLLNHLHGGVQSGPDDTGAPIP